MKTYTQWTRPVVRTDTGHDGETVCDAHEMQHGRFNGDLAKRFCVGRRSRPSSLRTTQSHKDQEHFLNFKLCRRACLKVTFGKDLTFNSSKALVNAVGQPPVSDTIDADNVSLHLLSECVMPCRSGRTFDHEVLADGLTTARLWDHVRTRMG